VAFNRVRRDPESSFRRDTGVKGAIRRTRKANKKTISSALRELTAVLLKGKSPGRKKGGIQKGTFEEGRLPRGGPSIGRRKRVCNTRGDLACKSNNLEKKFGKESAYFCFTKTAQRELVGGEMVFRTIVRE